jgi:hypothetical protein
MIVSCFFAWHFLHFWIRSAMMEPEKRKKDGGERGFTAIRAFNYAPGGAENEG